MKQIYFLIVFAIILTSAVNAQVGINTGDTQPDPSAMLDVKSTTKGFLPPRMTTVQRDEIVSPATGLVIFNTDCNDIQYFNGGGWVPMGNTGMLATPNSIIGSTTPCSPGTAIEVPYSTPLISGATGYLWTVPPGSTIINGQGADSIIVSFGPNSGLVCVAAYNSCMRGDMFCIEVSPMQSSPISVSIVASANPICTDSIVIFTATPTNGGISPTYQWKVNEIIVNGATNTTYTYVPENGDAVTCVMTPNVQCFYGNPFTSNMITMTVNPSLPVSVTITVSENPVNTGTLVTFSATPVNGGSSPSYQWKVNGSNVGTNASSYTYVPVNNDSIICVLISNQDCASGSPAASNLIVMVVNLAFACPGTPTVIYGGQTYNTVQIGDQCWLKENLNIGLKADGSQTQSNNGIIEKYCYGDLESNCGVYGGLYQWNEMMQYETAESGQGICPAGWHIPKDSELTILTTFLGGEGTAGGKMKEMGIVHWKTPNTGATNISSFTVLPGGQRLNDNTYFSDITGGAYLWSSTENGSSGAWEIDLSYHLESIYRHGGFKWAGNSVRCLKDCLTNPNAPTSGPHVPSPTEIIWTWNTVTGATGYKWSTTNDYTSASNIGISTTKTETGLTPNTPYTRYVWAYNSCGASPVTTLTSQTTSFAIGQSYGGGIIFYIDGTGQHGLISATSDQSDQCQWGCSGIYIGSTSIDIGTGQANTMAIVNRCSQTDIAARYCNELVQNGYEDWFLPSKDELNQMYSQKTLIGEFADYWYWSSSEYDGFGAWMQRFTDGSQGAIANKSGYYICGVRAIRAF